MLNCKRETKSKKVEWERRREKDCIEVVLGRGERTESISIGASLQGSSRNKEEKPKKRVGEGGRDDKVVGAKPEASKKQDALCARG
jgi:hypothetical protein